MKLYEIDAEIEACVDNETGEIIDEEKLNALMMERNKKIEAVALWVKNIDSLTVAIKNEMDVLKKRRETAENKANSLREWLKNAVDCQPFETAKVRISFRRSELVEVDENVLPECWCRKKISYAPDKKAIKNALQYGQEIKGAKLVVNQNIQIK